MKNLILQYIILLQQTGIRYLKNGKEQGLTANIDEAHRFDKAELDYHISLLPPTDNRPYYRKVIKI